MNKKICFYFFALFGAVFLNAAGSATGVVKDAVTNLPIQGATVVAIRNSIVIDTDITDINGNYSMPTLQPGQYVFTASATNYQTAIVGALIKNNVITIVNFALNPTPGTISGTITESTHGDPISGALVEIFDGLILIASDTTDILGEYEISGLAAGNYIVRASATNFQSKTVGATVIAAQTTTVNLALDPDPGTVSGKITESTHGTPIAGALVEIFHGLILEGSTLTDVNGDYEITGLHAGNFIVKASADDFQTKTVGATVIAGSTTTVNLALDPDPSTISGKIIESTHGTPIAGALVEIFHGLILEGFALTDINGDYEITGLHAGNYIVRASADDFQTKTVGATVPAGSTTTVNLALDPNPGTISGKVTNALFPSENIAGALVEVFFGTIPMGSILTDNDGNYILSNLAPNNYNMKVTADGFFDAFANAEVFSNQTTTVNFSLTPIPNPPQGIWGRVISNRFLTQTDRIHRIEWLPSGDTDTLEYRIRRNGKLIKIVKASENLLFDDHNRNNNTQDTYTITSFSSFHKESSPVSITLK